MPMSTSFSEASSTTAEASDAMSGSERLSFGELCEQLHDVRGCQRIARPQISTTAVWRHAPLVSKPLFWPVRALGVVTRSLVIDHSCAEAR